MLGEFSFTIIGSNDIKGSKSDVAINIGYHKAIIHVVIFLSPLTKNSSIQKDRKTMLSRYIFILKIIIKTVFASFALCEVSFLAELTLGYRCYHLTDETPQSNSHSDNVFRADCPDVKYRSLEQESRPLWIRPHLTK